MRFGWTELDASRAVPPLDPDLAGWEIQKRRKSHWNAARTAGGKTYFLKWFFHGRWANPARREWLNARVIASLGIPTVLAAGWGRHSSGSFIVLEGSPGASAEAWWRKGASRDALRRPTAVLAAHAARLHDARLCHRDLNVYHVLVESDELRLIDVGRVARFRRRRWIVKDLASLLASAWHENFPLSAARLFLRKYLASTRRRWNRRRLLRAVIRKAQRYRKRDEGR